ncbi:MULTISPECIES: hypothetical protein [unclassified Sinorhizobium]|uniref:hypothetical protein n=1 Tax=unclassified Sinorhizobium TaxID=2613772 RepID=UPI00352483EE
MTGKKTHEQQMRVIEKRENTANADADFDPRTDLKKSSTERARERQGQDLHAHDPVQGEDRSILKGANQESEHHKKGKAKS